MKVASLTDPELFYESADAKCSWCERELLDDDIMLDDAGRPHCSAACIQHTAEAVPDRSILQYEVYQEAA